MGSHEEVGRTGGGRVGIVAEARVGGQQEGTSRGCRALADASNLLRTTLSFPETVLLQLSIIFSKLENHHAVTGVFA